MLFCRFIWLLTRRPFPKNAITFCCVPQVWEKHAQFSVSHVYLLPVMPNSPIFTQSCSLRPSTSLHWCRFMARNAMKSLQHMRLHQGLHWPNEGPPSGTRREVVGNSVKNYDVLTICHSAPVQLIVALRLMAYHSSCVCLEHLMNFVRWELKGYVASKTFFWQYVQSL